jgi:DNA-binding NtrC family response regulator
VDFGRVQVTATDKVLVGSQKPLAGRRVLVVEDEYFIAEEMRQALAASGAEVLGPFAEVRVATAALKSGVTIDLALLDINVRSEMVFPLARALRSREVPFVFTTGYGKASLSPEFQDVELWQKPLDLSRALTSLAYMLSRGPSKEVPDAHHGSPMMKSAS